jgi:Holliday junction resolvasome RuvABC DNA-binding subunit
MDSKLQSAVPQQDDMVFQALLALGYKSFEALKAIQSVAEKKQEMKDLGDWVQACLKELN